MIEYVEFYTKGKSVWHEYWSGKEYGEIPTRGKIVESWAEGSAGRHLVWTNLGKRFPHWASNPSGEWWDSNGALYLKGWTENSLEPLLWVEYDSPDGTFWLNYYTGEFWSSLNYPSRLHIVESWISTSRAPRDFKCLWSRMSIITSHYREET